MGTVPRNENGQLEPGTLLAGRYRIERFLAGGGMGLVYIAHDQRLANRRCAVKEIFDRFTNAEERTRAIEYFQREADTLSQINHPAIPAIFDRFGEGNCHYLVMDFIEGINLENELATRGGSLPESQVIEIARELCDVLSYLHSFRPPIVYRDMKPGNVILTPSGRAALIDFGIARIFSPQGKATLIGTPGFAPPEQYAGTVDPRSDIYGLAAMLHYLLTGRDPEKNPPFSFPSVHSLKPEASPFLAQAIDRALAYKPEERPESAAAFKEMILYGRGVYALSPASGATRSVTQPLQSFDQVDTAVVEVAEEFRPPRKRRHWGRRIAALLFFALLGGAAYQVFTHPEWLESNTLARFGEQIPWQKIEALLPEWGQVRLRQFIENLPWEREKRLQALRADPIELVTFKVLNTSRDGTPLPNQKEAYTEGEIQYLTWEAEIKNRLAGVEGATYRLEGRVFDPEGKPTGKSEAGRVVRQDEAQLNLRGITLLEGVKERAKGNYQFELYFGEKKLATQTFRIEAEPKKVAKVEKPEVGEGGEGTPALTRGLPPPPNPADEERKRMLEEDKRLAAEAKRQNLITERSRKPLELVTVRFFNTTKEGKRLSSPGKSFPASAMRFMTWEAQFRNRLQELAPAYHRVEATYYAPNGQPLGTVQDAKEVDEDAERVTFTARIGNATGGAFAPGEYRVDFYVNGYPLASRQFTVDDDRVDLSQARTEERFPSDSERVATAEPPPLPVTRRDLRNLLHHHVGSLLGLEAGREVDLEIDFRPRGDGSLSGEVTIHASGFGTAPLEGRLEGNEVEFNSPWRGELFHFRGWRDENRLGGTYTISPSGGEGRWSVRLANEPSP
jgi:serine/threonine-protein kinase